MDCDRDKCIYLIKRTSDATNLKFSDFYEYNSLAKELVHSTKDKHQNIGTFFLVREEAANDSNLDSPIF